MFFYNVLLAASCLNLLVPLSRANCDMDCADKPVFTPSRLLVKHGDPASAACAVCRHACQSDGIFGLEKSIGVDTRNGTTISWTVDSMTEWSTSPLCFYDISDVDDLYHQCCSVLHIKVYQPPVAVSITFVDHTGPLAEGRQHTLRCTVQDVAPVEHLSVTFYRGQAAMGRLQSNHTISKKPVTDIFTLTIIPSGEDDGVQYWCEAMLDFGSEAPQRPPVVISENITATVHYKPHLEGPSHPDPVILPEGKQLQLNCSAVGNPSPSFTWTLPSDGPSPSNSSTLTVTSVTPADRGQYTCSVSNAMGTVSVMFTVEVRVSHIRYIVPATLIPAILLVILGVFLYIRYYQHTRMGQYNPRDVLRFRNRHRAVPTE